MIWLYWHRWRNVVLAAVASMVVLGALVIVAGSLAGAPPAAPPVPAGAAHGGAMARQGTPFFVSTPSSRQGLRLMHSAAYACDNVAYRGVQVVAWLGTSGSSAYTISVWHRQGGPALTENNEDEDGGLGTYSGSGQAARSSATIARAQNADGVLTISGWMLVLLQRNYVLDAAGTGSAGGRPARIVLARRRADGSLAAKYWLDSATSLPLRREIYDSSGRLVNEGAFIDLHVGDAEVGVVPAAGISRWNSKLTLAGLASLRQAGWPVPGALAGGMSLVNAARKATASGAVVDASYSDGLSVISIFLQRGQLSAPPAGWKQAAVRGEAVYVSQPDQRSLTWSARGFVYTVIADAPQDAVQRIVAGLPHDSRDGFWQRVSRGLKRMGSWLDPFS